MFGGLTGRIFLFGRAKGGLSAEGAKLIAKGKKPFTTRGLEERRKLPQRGLGQSPRNRCDFEHVKPKWINLWDPVNLAFLNN